MNNALLASTRPFALPPRSSLAAADPGAPVPAQPDPAGPPDALAVFGGPQPAPRGRRVPTFSLTLPPAPPAHHLFVALPGGGRAKSKIYRAWLRAAQGALRDQHRVYLGGRVAVSLQCPRRERLDLAAQEQAPLALLVAQGFIDDARNVEQLAIAWHDGRDLIVTVRQP